ncbi:MAG: glyoxylate/hydroxypyruvate reductase A [Pseudomonadota bacterium]
MALIFSSDEDDPVAWRQLILDILPDLDFRIYPDDEGDPNDINYALVNPAACGILRRYPNLKAVFSLFAGVEHIVAQREILPPGVPIIRLVSPDLTDGMAEYVALHALRYYRDHDAYAQQSADGVWNSHPLNEDYRKVGIMGLGVLGQAAARMLRDLGFDVAGWSRSKKVIDGVECYAGADQLAPFLARSHTLVSLLPLTAETENLINAGLLSRLPRGAYFINAARGGQVVDADLLAALDDGGLAGATLDVFREEPLPLDHVFWRHPKITVTPHVASVTRPCRVSAQWYTDNIKSIEAGAGAIGGVVDLDAGY